LKTTPSYGHELRASLGKSIFEPARSRLIWLPFWAAVIATSTVAIARLPILAIALSPVVGIAFAALMFLGHEILHGAVVRGRAARHLLGFLAMLPFTLSPRLWVAWHNRVHHGHTNDPAIDPDANPTRAQRESSRWARVITDHFALGRGTWSGPLGLTVGFSVQSVRVLLMARRRKYLTTRGHAVAIAETATGLGLAALLAFVIGPIAFLLAFLVPLVIANTIVMTFIMTNHALSPISKDNDPVASSLTVTLPRWIEWLTLGFGYHVEHHVFPAMSARHAPRVRAALAERWGETYRSMPLFSALRLLHQTGRVYADETTLCDPKSGKSWPCASLRPEALDGAFIAVERGTRAHFPSPNLIVS
jgi:fatty acid desaturase